MYAFDLVVALGSSQTGLTLTASVRDTAGTALGSQPAYTVVEHGGGWYSYHTSAMPDGQRGVVRLLSGATVMAVGVVTPIESENADVKTSTRGTSTYAGGAVASVTAGVTVATNNDKTGYTASTVSDKTGYSLAGTQAFNLTGNITGNVTGNLSGSVGSLSGVTFPANFAALAIAATTGQVGLNFDDIKQASGATTLTNITVPAVTTTATATNLTNLPTMPTDWLTAAGLKADAVTKIMAGLPEGPDLTDFATAFVAAWKADAEVITLLASGASLDLMVVDDGAGAYEFTAGALANAPASGTAPTAADIWAYGTRTLTSDAAIATAVRSELATELARVDAAITSRAAAATALSTAVWTGGKAAFLDAAISSAGGGSVTVAGYASGQSPADLVLATPARKLATDVTGRVDLNLSQTGLTARALDSVADSALTVGDGFVAAISGAAGRESVASTAYLVKTPSTGTVIRTFTLTLDGDGAPTARN